MKKAFIIAWISATTWIVPATNIDSLLNLYSNTKGAQKTEILIQLSEAYVEDSASLALSFAQEAMQSINHIKETKFYATALDALINALIETERYDTALVCIEELIDLHKNKNDEAFILATLKKAQCFRSLKKSEQAFEVYDGLLSASSNFGNKKLAQKIYDQYINASFKLSNFGKTNDLILEKLSIDSTLNDSSGLGEDYNNLSTIRRKQGIYPEAIMYNRKALEIFGKINDLPGLASTYSSLGGIYYYTDDYEQAIRHFIKAAEIFEKLKDIKILPGVYNNMGSVFNELKNYPKALEYYKKALTLYKKQNNRFAEAIVTGNLGLVLVGMGYYDQAENYFNKSLLLQKALENIEGILHSYSNLGGLNLKKGNFEESEKNYQIALQMAVEGGYVYEQLNISKEMVDLLEAKGEFKEALQLMKQYQTLKDTLQNQESRDQLNEMQAQLDLKDHQVQIELLNKENEIATEKFKRQQVISFGVILIAGLLLILVVIVFLALRFNRKAKIKLEHQNTEISRQNTIIQIKNKQFTDSIAYAGRVQKALFSPLSNLEEFLEGFFITSKPQNLVSGDFFWYKIVGQKLFLALADCTRHGVPGAFMSILGNTLLNEVIEDNCRKTPNQILDELRDKIKTSLHQKNMQGNTDGMDVSLCIISKEEKLIHFAGAYNPLFRWRKGIIAEFKADKMPVSISMKELPFTMQVIPIEAGDLFYLSTDGYFDQFGGPYFEKITRKNFKELAVNHGRLPLKEQAEKFSNFFEAWKNNNEQTDDMTVVGFQII